jgi:DNA-binding beta-propeller fold protein YncE
MQSGVGCRTTWTGARSVPLVLATLAVLQCSLRFPVAPGPPAGPQTTLRGERTEYVVHYTDKGADPFAVRFSWGDGDTSAWTDYMPNGAGVLESHVWTEPGLYEVCAQARTTRSRPTAWSYPLVVRVCAGLGVPDTLLTTLYAPAVRDMAASPMGGDVYIGRRGMVSVIGRRKCSVTDLVEMELPTQLQVSADGRLLFMLSNGDLHAYDLDSHNFVQAVPSLSSCERIALAKDIRVLYVLSHGRVLPVDVARGKCGPTFGAGPDPSDLTATPDGRRVFVGNNHWSHTGTVLSVDPKCMSDTVRVRVGTWTLILEMSPDGDQVYVLCYSASYTDDIWVIDTDGNAVTGWLGHPGPSWYADIGDIAVSPDNSLLALASGAGRVWFVDTESRTLVDSLSVPRPTLLTWSGDGSKLYVASSNDSLYVLGFREEI